MLPALSTARSTPAPVASVTPPPARVLTALGPGRYRHLARITGHARQHVRRVLLGRSGVSLAALTHIADAAGVTMDEVTTYIEWKRATDTTPPSSRKSKAGVAKTTRNRMIVEARGSKSIKHIASMFKISPTRVRQIWERDGRKGVKR